MIMKSNFYKNKNVLVAGGTGMIGICLINKLLKLGANISIASLESRQFAQSIFGNHVQFVHTNLMFINNCLKVTKNMDLVFNLVGIKGSVGIGEKKAVSYFIPMLRFQTNLMEAAFKNKVKRFLFVSSICAYPYSRVAKEEDTVWNGMPLQNDRIPGIAKRVGELQGETYLREYGWDAVRIVRPSNVYGPFDDFNPETAQVIPALIARMIGGENPVTVWGDGSARRDFIFVDDVAEGMILALEKAPCCFPINLGAGKAVSIKRIAETIAKRINPEPKIQWDITKPSGDNIRVLSTRRAEEVLNFVPAYSLSEGIKKTVDWYLKHRTLKKYTYA